MNAALAETIEVLPPAASAITEFNQTAAGLRAEEERIAAEQKAAVEQAEAAYIANANLREAAEAAFILLDSLVPEHLVTRALGAALERDA